MQFQVKGRNLEVSDAIRSYAESKLSQAGAQLRIRAVELELAVERIRRSAEPGRRGHDLDERSRSAGARGVRRHAGVDRPARRQARAPGHRYRTRARDRRRRAARANGPAPDTIADMSEENEPQIVKTKQFA
jgi:hypothetical protein